MAEFIETEILSKEIDNDTYFLVPLEKTEHEQQNILVISKNFDENYQILANNIWGTSIILQTYKGYAGINSRFES